MKLNTILLIDDSKSTNSLNEKLILKSGICKKVTSFENPKLAMEFINIDNINSIDLILIDLLMPELSGIDVLKNISAKFSQVKKKPILIVLTDSKDTEKYNLVKDFLGADDYIRKPLDEDDLLEIIDQHFRN